jgi:hypothetical protein
MRQRWVPESMDLDYRSDNLYCDISVRFDQIRNHVLSPLYWKNTLCGRVISSSSFILMADLIWLIVSCQTIKIGLSRKQMFFLLSSIDVCLLVFYFKLCSLISIVFDHLCVHKGSWEFHHSTADAVLCSCPWITVKNISVTLPGHVILIMPHLSQAESVLHLTYFLYMRYLWWW